MKRILIVEDNKTLAKILAKKIELSLKYEVDVAYKLSEAKLFLKKYEYFITLLDINLPDAPNGEIVDYVLSKGNHAIVLSANIDKEFRKKMLQKNIIDYVNKGGVDDINYIIQTIQRLEKNQKHKVLVVDDSMVFRKMMKEMLENLFYNVITVAHGEEAVGMLTAHSDISLVITDYNMPVMNGLELTNEIRKDYKKSELCIIAISSNNDEEVNALFLKHGANDYIKKPFSKEEFSCRINNSIEALENIQFITNHANRDFLTGLYNRRYFFQNMQEYIEDTKESGEQFAVSMIDIDNFKHINDTYGHDIGDKVITSISEILRTNTSYRDIVARFGGEEFCVVLKNINKYSASDILERLRQEVEKFNFTIDANKSIKFTISIGVSIHDDDDTLEETINQADMMLHGAKQNGKNRIEFS
ncbi:response regulator receiver modulated diguanylate cyclase [Sulfurimonas gotlandica GD1]|uniref:diguanylate cyclase n=1 Tax=Sulfurimonas gotlandica (strain DSM 19862 / JCM 16533 / GD1) TaxID=929558 RepID=B6BIB7_SULGG|nr:diguanylate cyclase [Sulfurimonas gotlandica]EDZ63187.1 diguanylate cyclase [Sulfurimonas gotlandica GD1]EHP30270.1 response regulator receiver modulated diguanylate cyclase [Sulfurimonas gotlandica GD1]